MRGLQEIQRANNCGYAEAARTQRAELNEEISYWRKRCVLAEAFIETHVADPDITDEMCNAHSEWMTFKDGKEL